MFGITAQNFKNFRKYPRDYIYTLNLHFRCIDDTFYPIY